jgi:hypothetical protein
MGQRFRNHPKNKGKATKADRKVKTIAGRLVRELGRKLPPSLYQDTLALFKQVLAQKKTDSNKIYSLHEPHVQCISKSKEHKIIIVIILGFFFDNSFITATDYRLFYSIGNRLSLILLPIFTIIPL